MKKNLKLLFLSHLPGKVSLLMRLVLIIVSVAMLNLPAIAEDYGNSGSNTALQQQKVTGTITDEATGEALVGVNVVVEGTTVGVSTDIDGKYAIQVPNKNASLVITYIGYVAQTVAINGRTVVDVALQSDVQALEDVVVVGYGSVRKSDLTGSVSSVKTADLLQMPTQRVDQALQGRTAGVFIMNTDASPGGNTMIRIRGLNSIMGGNEPLIVIDGLQGGKINSLNPNDIASMEVLKDASATAIYGSRGANGVILITTKLGQLGKPVIDAGYNVGFQRLARKLPVMNAYEFATMFNKYRMTQTGQGNIPQPEFSDDELEYYKTHSTDWQDEVYETGVLQNTNLSISGATERIKYMVSGNYLDHNGILLNSQYNRISLRTNVSADITEWVDFGLNYSYTKEKYESPSFRDEVGFVSQVINNAPRWAPTEPVYDENGNYWRHRSGYGASDTWNPVASAVEPIIDNPSYRSNANLFLNFKPLTGLSIKIMGGAQFGNDYYRDYYNTKTLTGLQNNGWGHVNESLFERFQNTNIITYDNTFAGIHHITFTGVIEQIAEDNKGSNMLGKEFLVDQLAFDNMAGAGSINVSSWHNKRSLLSYMGRINYGLFGKYLITLSYRADASSVFGEDNKWGFFPSGSVAWRISEENFLKDSPVINDLKLRFSYGVTGNQGISPYNSLASIGSGGGYNYPWNGQSATDIGFGLSGIANPELKWETTSQSNLGVDISLYKGRLISTIDVYRKVTDDLLMPRELPGYVGVGSVLDNIGSIENKGIEIMIGGDPIVGDFNWNSSFNFTLNRNKILDLGPDDRIGFTPSSGGYSLGNNFMFLEVGESFGLMNGWKFLGIWGTDEEEEARRYGQLPGDPKYADIAGVNSEGKIVMEPDGQVNTYDRTTIGNGYPDFTWGFTNVFTYKGAELSFLMIGSHGNDLFNTMRIRRESFWEGTDPKIMNYWTPDNQDTDVPGLIDGAYREAQHLTNKYNFGNNSGATSRWVEDASFIKFKTITLAYSFQQNLLRRVGFTKARVYVSGTNLITFTDYTGYDPEVAAFADRGDANIGVDLSVYPPAKTYTLGIDFTF